jgi:transposase-like protein
MAMKTRRGKKRDPLRERFWRRTLADQARSGLTIQAYCRRNSLNPATFSSWRQELAQRDAESTPARMDERPASSTELVCSPAFLPVRVVQDARAPSAPAAPIEIMLPSGPTHPADRLGELLPDAWLETHPHARRKVAS